MSSYMPKSKSDVHITPNEVKEMTKEKWGLDWDNMFDPCPVNPKFDGLNVRWHKENAVNPPYGDGSKDENGNTLLANFVTKAIYEAGRGNISVMLLPSKTDQGWFHSIIYRKYEIVWIKGGLKFKGAKWSATQPHFLVMIK